MTMWLTFSVVVCLSGSPPAQEPNRLLLDDRARASVTAATAVALREPLGSAGILAHGKGVMQWEDSPAASEKISASEKAAPIDSALLAGVEDREPVRNADENYNEYQAFNYALLQAHKTPAAALARGTRRDLTFAHLFGEPEKYRGQIVHIEGRLKRVRKFDTNQQVIKEGVRTLYEAWIFTDQSFGNPHCVVFTELPRSIELGEDVNHRVSFDGYFFKRYRYKAAVEVRDAPLLIGRALTLGSGQAEESEATVTLSVPDGLLGIFLVLLFVTFAVGIGLAVWFRRGDRRVRRELAKLRRADFIEPEVDGEP
jgi:hypothetical protein